MKLLSLCGIAYLVTADKSNWDDKGVLIIETTYTAKDDYDPLTACSRGTNDPKPSVFQVADFGDFNAAKKLHLPYKLPQTSDGKPCTDVVIKGYSTMSCDIAGGTLIGSATLDVDKGGDVMFVDGITKDAYNYWVAGPTQPRCVATGNGAPAVTVQYIAKDDVEEDPTTSGAHATLIGATVATALMLYV